MSTKRSETNETKRNARSSFPFVLLHPLFNPVVHPHERNHPCRRTRSPSTYLHAPMRAFFDSLASPVPRATRTPRRRSGSIFVNFASCVNVIVRRVGRPIPTAENGDVRGRSGDLNRHPLCFRPVRVRPFRSVGIGRRVARPSSSSSVIVERCRRRARRRTSLSDSPVSSRSPVPNASTRRSSRRPAPCRRSLSGRVVLCRVGPLSVPSRPVDVLMCKQYSACSSTSTYLVQ